MQNSKNLETLDRAVEFWRSRVRELEHQLTDARAEMHHNINRRSLLLLKSEPGTKKAGNVISHTKKCLECGATK